MTAQPEVSAGDLVVLGQPQEPESVEAGLQDCQRRPTAI